MLINIKIPAIVINTTAECLKEGKSLYFFNHLRFDEKLKIHAQLS